MLRRFTLVFGCVSAPMRRFSIVCVGKMRNGHLAAQAQELEKMLRPFARLTVIETNDVKRSNNSNLTSVRKEEAKLLLKALPEKAFIVACDEKGKEFSTDGLMAWLETVQQSNDHIAFVIGGPDGLQDDVLQRADARFSLSRLTFTHEMARTLLTEQLYRVSSMQAGHPYHRR